MFQSQPSPSEGEVVVLNSTCFIKVLQSCVHGGESLRQSLELGSNRAIRIRRLLREIKSEV